MYSISYYNGGHYVLIVQFEGLGSITNLLEDNNIQFKVYNLKGGGCMGPGDFGYGGYRHWLKESDVFQ